MVLSYFNFNFTIIMAEHFSNVFLLNINIVGEQKEQDSLSFFHSCQKHMSRKSDLTSCIT